MRSRLPRRRIGMIGVLVSLVAATVLAVIGIGVPDMSRDLDAMQPASAGLAPNERTDNYPAFAPHGVIIVPAPDSRVFSANDAVTQERAERVEVQRTTERARRAVSGQGVRARAARSEPSLSREGDGRERLAPVTSPDATPDDIASGAGAVAEGGEVDNGRASDGYQQDDSRSWYRSPAYWREVERRRRAQQTGRIGQ